ncbi:MAG: C69 family dipeptidase [Dehalococcoidia bacterium]
MKKKIFGILFAAVLAVSLTLVPALADNDGMPAGEDTFDCAPYSIGCTDILVGKDASADGSVMGSYCCDGAIYSKLEVIPGEQHEPGTMIPLYYRPYGIYDEEYDEEDVYLGEIPQVEETYRYVASIVYIDDQWVGGLNEHGLWLGETTIGGKRILRFNPNAWMWVYSNFQETSLMSLALQRAKTAREAIQVMGELAETYGYHQFGEHVTVVDGNEVWAFEIFGPGPDWTHDCDKPGAVWAAQRVPDDHVAFSANRARIGEIIEDDPDNFMYSSNVYDLALELGLWDGEEPFIWYYVYGGRGHALSLREWSVYNLVAPSKNIEQGAEEWPFSVEPDNPVSVQDVINIHRDYFTGIEDLDVTMDPAYQIDGETSPLASPFGPSELHKLLGIRPQRSIATRASVFVNVAQVRDWLPEPVKGVLWHGAGPGVPTLHVPVYSGVTELPDEWTYTPKTYYDRDSAWWAFTFVDGLSLIKWQDTIEDIRAVRDPAEAALFAKQDEVESVAVELYEETKGWGGEEAAKEFITRYSNLSMSAVSDAYWELFDYLLFKYFFRAGEYVTGRLSITPPVVAVPEVDEILTLVPPIGPPKGPPAGVPAA